MNVSIYIIRLVNRHVADQSDNKSSLNVMGVGTSLMVDRSVQTVVRMLYILLNLVPRLKITMLSLIYS